MKISAVNKVMAALYQGYGMQPQMPKYRYRSRPRIMKHHSHKECGRRRNQLQHQNQVKNDLLMKGIPV